MLCSIWNTRFSCLLGPSSNCAINTAEGKWKLLIFFICKRPPREFEKTAVTRAGRRLTRIRSRKRPHGKTIYLCKITGACGWQTLFRPGQILYSQSNFQRNFRISSNFPLGFRMKSSIYVNIASSPLLTRMWSDTRLKYANFQSFPLFSDHKYCTAVLVTSLISSL